MTTRTIKFKQTSELVIGDHVLVANGAYATAIVKAVYPDRVTFFRPYALLVSAPERPGPLIYGSGSGQQAIAAVGIEQFDFPLADMRREWQVVS